MFIFVLYRVNVGARMISDPEMGLHAIDQTHLNSLRSPTSDRNDREAQDTRSHFGKTGKMTAREARVRLPKNFFRIKLSGV
jgi:hypothetical protein